MKKIPYCTSKFSATLDALSVKPLITFIVPVYNTKEHLLRRCIDSILGQTYKDLEIIIVDDGNDDECASAILKIAQLDSRIKMVSGGHKGVSHARNVAMAQAVGDWIAFADSDDEYVATFAEEALSVALHFDCDLVCGDVVGVYANGPEKYKADDVCYLIGGDNGNQEIKDFACQVLGNITYSRCRELDIVSRGPVAKLYKISTVASCSFNENIAIGEDTLFNYYAINSCKRIAIINQGWYLYYQYSHSSLHSFRRKIWVDSIENMVEAGSSDDFCAPFLTRGAYLAFQGSTCAINCRGFFKGADDSIELLKFAKRKGCFGPPSFCGYEMSFWIKTMKFLCSRNCWLLAHCFWYLKTVAAQTIKRASLI